MARALTGHRGFTLIEILAVLFIIGIVLTFATLSIGNRAASDRLHHEARRLDSLMQLASQHAVIDGVEIGFDITPDGYQFLRLDTNGWTPITASDKPLRKRKLPAPMHLSVVKHNSKEVNLVGAQGEHGQNRAQGLGHNEDAGSGSGLDLGQAGQQALGLDMPADQDRNRHRKNDTKGHTTSRQPEAIFLSSSEVTPFTIRLRSDNTKDTYTFTGKLTGKISMQARVGDAE